MTSNSLKIIKAAMLGYRKEQQPLQSLQPPKISKLQVFIIFFVTLTTTAFFSLFFSSYTQGFGHGQNQNDTPAHTVSENSTSTSVNQEKQTLPTRLKIPAINVDTTIEYVGLTPEGAMDVPSVTSSVGWFNLGPRPGEKGSAVVAGHSSGEDGKPAVFNTLHQLRQGDLVYVEQEDGKSITFIVRKTQIYSPGYADAIFGLSDGTYLNLITCDGTWDEQAQTYSKRLVVFAELVE